MAIALGLAVGDTLRKIRLEQGLTLRDVSARSYIALGYLSELERGHKQASYDVLESLASTLHLTTKQLIKEIYDYLEEH
jgi:transcriptional regulator with XRE-family HTH domain